MLYAILCSEPAPVLPELYFISVGVDNLAIAIIFTAMPDGQPPMSDSRSKARDGAPRLAAARGHAQTVARPVLAGLGLVLLILSIPIGVLTPFLPIGLPFGILGVVLLGRNSRAGKRWMERVLKRHPRVERLAPNWLMKTVFGRDKA